MAHAAAGSNCCTAPARIAAGRRLACWRAAERLERLLAALRASLAEETLPALDADVRALLATMTWAQLADILRLTRSCCVAPRAAGASQRGAAPDAVAAGGRGRALAAAATGRASPRARRRAGGQDREAV